MTSWLDSIFGNYPGAYSGYSRSPVVTRDIRQHIGRELSSYLREPRVSQYQYPPKKKHITMLDLVQEARRVRRDSSSQPMLSELERIAERMKIHGFVTEVTGSDQTVVRYRGQLYDLAD